MTRTICYAVIVIVIALHFAYILHFSVNFPYLDDFLLIQFIEAITRADASFADVLGELFKTCNDHKPVIPRLLSWLDFALTGHLHFRFYILVTSLNLLYIFGFFYRLFGKLGLPVYYFLPVPFIFFQPLYHEVSGWALTGLQHSFLTAFLVTAISLAQRDSMQAFYGAMCCCLLATYTHGNGIFSFAAVVCYYVCMRDLGKAGATMGFMMLALGLYLLGYEPGQAAQAPSGVLPVLLSFICFIGSGLALWNDPSWWAGIGGGVALTFMLVTFRSVLKREYRLVKPVTASLLSIFLFILITGLVIATVRSWAGTIVASRFQLYGVMVIILVYLLALDRLRWLRRPRFVYGVTAASVCYCVYAYYLYTGTVATKKAAYEADIYNWKNNHRMFSVDRSFIRNAGFYLLPACRSGIVQLPVPLVSKSELEKLFETHATSRTAYRIYLSHWNIRRLKPALPDSMVYHFVASDLLPAFPGLLTERFLVLRSCGRGNIFLLPAIPKVEARKVIAATGRYYKGGFNTMLRTDDLDTGCYDLGLLDVGSNGKRNFYRLDKALDVKAGKLTLL
ncbi:hypothetical protein [Dyadobacter sandarakinus]|uniref:Uncharacterized protein n=1 Tax=Dyadobacter sandarakinus TaxID=2747268 RepID=A0ABX7I8B0_9BACT|nr:hypothetical protein [Dyadobacter sandarakinus]QRR01777.1 hypothetical protein HWI92_13085 [Dyadobacter sandarakinus]